MTNTKKRSKLVGSNPADLRNLLFRLDVLGVEVRRGKHIQVLIDGHVRYTISSTPSCPRSVLNAVSGLRSVGIDVRRMTVT